MNRWRTTQTRPSGVPFHALVRYGPWEGTHRSERPPRAVSVNLDEGWGWAVRGGQVGQNVRIVLGRGEFADYEIEVFA